MSLLDNDSFIQKNIVRDVMRTFGWTLTDYIGYQEFALMRADFYPTGFVLATSKRAIITCDGESEISLEILKNYMLSMEKKALRSLMTGIF